jgi:hypothetical protein
LLGRGPSEWDVFLGEVEQRVSDFRLIVDESSVKVAKSKEGLDLLDFGRSWPFSNALDFGGIHVDVSVVNNNAKVFNRSLIKGAFLRFEIEVVLGETAENFMC